MNSDRVKGAIDEVAGTIKRKAGELTGDTPLQIKGIAQQVKGKLEGVVGEAKDAVHAADGEARTQNSTHVRGSGPLGGTGRKQ
jgi:uncharacterized protein YjbJ (UPF0337 family)